MQSNDVRPLTVVVAEDDYLVSLAVLRAAEGAGLKVIGTAADGGEALELVKQLSPNAVILDVQMPVMNGLEVAGRLRDEHPTPVVFLTAYESPEFLREAKKAGAGAYLTKPPDAASLGRAVEIAAARHHDLQELRRVNGELRNALQMVETLRGILPICSYCKKIRNSSGSWEQIEAYVSRHSTAQFSHGFCPDCLAEHYPEVAREMGIDGE